MMEEDRTNCIAEDWTHDVQVPLGNFILQMKYSKCTELLMQNIKIIDVCHKFMNNIHDQSCVIIKKIIKDFIIVRINLGVVNNFTVHVCNIKTYHTLL